MRNITNKKIEPREKLRIVVGRHAIAELLHIRQQSVARIEVRKDWETQSGLRELVKYWQSRKLNLKFVSVQELDRVCSGHQGVILYAQYLPELELNQLPSTGSGIVLALDGLEDPHNFGAIIRTAWLTSCAGILTSEHGTVDLGPATHKVAAGGVEHVRVRREASLRNTLTALKEKGYWVYGLSHKAKNNIFAMKYPERCVLVLGSESSGLRTTTESVCDELVSIPQSSSAASYNASVAIAMALTEVIRQQNKPQN